MRLQQRRSKAADHVERMLALYPGFWQGIGEAFLRHDELTALTYGDAPRATSSAFGRLLDLAAARDLPVLVHSNIGSAWLEQPDYLGEIESAIQTHPNTRIVWVHVASAAALSSPITRTFFAGCRGSIPTSPSTYRGSPSNKRLYLAEFWIISG